MIFAVERLQSAWDEIMVLAEQHWHETEMYRHGQPFNPVFDRYAQYDDAGWYIQFTARDDGRLVGYCGMYLVPSMHTQLQISTEDTWFLLPEYRKGRNALKFHRYVEDEVKKRGAVEIIMTAKTTNGACRILEYLGYDLVSYQFSKSLVQGADSTVRPHNMESNDHVRTLTTASP